MSQNNPLSVTDPMFWAFLGISIALIGIVFLLVFIIKKIRKKALKNVYYFDQKPRKITGLILGLAVFSSGLFLKIRFILNHEFEPAFDTDAARAMFNGEPRLITTVFLSSSSPPPCSYIGVDSTTPVGLPHF